MKRVAIFRSSLLPLSNTFIRDQARALQTWRPVLLGFREIENGLKAPEIECLLAPSSNGLLTSFFQRFWLPSPLMARFLKRLDVGLIHAHFGVDATQIWPSAKAADLPMLVTLHGYDINIHREWWEAGRQGKHMRAYPRRLLEMARHPKVHFIAVSEDVKLRAIEYGIPQKKVRVSYIGVDTQRFQPGGVPMPQRRKRILFVGRMVENKGVLLLIQAFSYVRGKVPDAELTMIGDGDLSEAAKQLAQQLGLPVEFLGARNTDEVVGQLHQARVLCLPSMTISSGASEAFGMVLLEAQACGVPVVTSSRGGKEGILNGVTGRAFDERDVVGCAQGLLRFLADDLPANTSELAREFVCKHFDIRTCTERLESIYDAITSENDVT